MSEQHSKVLEYAARQRAPDTSSHLDREQAPFPVHKTSSVGSRSLSDDSNDSCASESDSDDSIGSPKAGVAMDTEAVSSSTMRRSAFVSPSCKSDRDADRSASSWRAEDDLKPQKSTSATTSTAADEHCEDGEEPSVKRKRRPRPPTGVKLQCAVCGDVAFGYNFDAVSCESCKAFFRRNALRQHVCQNGNQCKIDKESRKYCSSCRLIKCLDVGMKRELILTPAKLEKRAKLVRKKHVHNSGSSASAGPSSAAHSVVGHPPAMPSGNTLSQPSCDSQAGIAARLCKPERLSSSTSTAPSSCSAAAPHCEACETGLAKHEHSDDCPYANIDFAGVSGPAAVAYAAAMLGSAAQRAGAPPSFVAQSIFPGTNPDLSAFAGACPAELLKLANAGRAPSLLAASRTEPGAQRFHPETMLAEMARLGLDMVAAVNAAASSHRRGSGQLGTPSPVPQIKQEHSPSPSIGRSPISEYRSLTGMTLPTINYEEIIGKCTAACEQLLRPLNPSDMRQMRPANAAYEQFNYGEVFVRRFVNAFKLIADFRAFGQVSQLKLLRNSMVSTLNIAGVFSFDVTRQAWVLQVENCEERVYLIKDMIALFESSGQTHIRDYMHSYCEFHTRLRNEFGSDVILFFVLILIDMFSPHRFAADREMLALLVPAHARYVQFLELYLVANYSSKHRSPSCAIGSPHSAFSPHGASGKDSLGGTANLPAPGSPLEPVVKQKLEFCLETLSNARTLEEYLAITSQYIGLTAMLPLLAEVCEYQLSLGSDTE